MIIRIIVIIFWGIFLSSCSNAPQLKVEKVEASNLFYDDAFVDYQNIAIESPKQIFALDETMKQFVAQDLIKIKDPQQRAKQILVKLFNKSPTSLRYQNGANLTAIDTFHQNTANCLSLTILAYALANEADLQVKFQEINIPEYWVREGEFNMLTGHVNLRISDNRRNNIELLWSNTDLVIDFDPYASKEHFSTVVISKQRVTSMFYNNKGAQAMVAGNFIKAYAYFKQAINIDLSFSAAWGNLGLLYRMVGLNQFAEQTYLVALNKDNKNYNTWTNLAILLSAQGKIEHAKKITEHLMKVRLRNPYYYALLGDEAYHSGDYKAAITHYKKAKNLNSKEDEFYFGLAKAYFKLGKYDTSEFYLAKAKRYANFKDVKNKYQQKLDLLTRL